MLVVYMPTPLACVKRVVYLCGMEKKDQRVQLLFSKSELSKLDEWRATLRIWSRSEAIRRIVAEALAR